MRPASRRATILTSPTHRAGPAFGVVLVLAGLLAAVSPSVPAARALDPTPDPSPSEPAPTQEATPDPTPAATPDPTPDATPDPTPDPTAEPTPAPTPDPTPDPTPAATPDPTSPPEASEAPVEPTPEPSADPSADPGATPVPTESSTPTGLAAAYSWVDTLDELGRTAGQGPLDGSLGNAHRFTVYRVTFRLVNAGDEPRTVHAGLRAASGDGWSLVPEVDPVGGRPFYAASDDGRRFRTRTEPIAVEDLRLPADADSTPVAGRSSSGVNPMPEVTIPAHGATEVAFAIRATTDAAWGTAYELRLVDGRAEVAGGRATITMGDKPVLELSPGQRQGRSVADPLPLYRLDPAVAMTDQPTTAGSGTATTASYQLIGPSATTAAAAGSFVSPHADYTLTTDACAACHSSHTAQGPLLSREPSPQAALCFTCHDGSGAVADVKADWTSPSLPANDASTDAWYSHPATAASAELHVSDKDEEFKGVLDRHAACADCHQPHLADATKPVDSVGGWSAGGAIKGASGVAVTNGPAGSAPAYAFQKTSTFEYQLCFKCHAGYTQLPAQDPAHPSRWALDKAIELNPANVAYHPVEAAGRNQTGAMTESLAGTSPFKLWSFETDETVRCLHCHGDSSVANPASPPTADARLDNHAGPNRGMLIAPYQDRQLNTAAALYEPADFGLCYTCHAEAPMVDDSGDVRTDTNFNWHGYHLNAIRFKGTGGTDIDVAGAGQGTATCAECHFRIHGSAFAVNGQPPAKGLVNFAPDVSAYNGQLTFLPATSTTLGTCTLTCHGKPHDGYVYAAAP